MFTTNSSSVTFADSLKSSDNRSRALEATLLQLRSEDVVPTLRGWRGECYVTWAAFKMDHSACELFGVRQYGVHITRYVRHSSLGLCVWFQKRYDTKALWPGAYGERDNENNVTFHCTQSSLDRHHRRLRSTGHGCQRSLGGGQYYQGVG